MALIGQTEYKNQNIIEMMKCNERICEMSAIEDIDVPVDPRINIEDIISDDPDPKFVNVEVLRAGVISKVNRRRYNNNIVREVYDLILGVQGFFGHPDPSKEGFEFREPQCIYVGRMIDHMPDGLDRCVAKAYLFKTSQLREWIPKSIAAGKPMTVSINAVGDVIRGNYHDGEEIIDVVHISELGSIDWANPGTEGVGTAQALSVVREMQDNNKGGSDMGDTVLNTQDIIKNVTVAELRAYNENSYNGVLKNATVQELQTQNPAVVAAIEENAKIKELQLKVGGEQKAVKISEMQGVIDKLEQQVSDLNSKIESAKIQELRTRLIAEQIPDKYRDKVAPRVTGNTEDEIKKSIEGEIAYIREMGGSWDNTPVGRQQDGGDDIKQAVADMFGHKKQENK